MSEGCFLVSALGLLTAVASPGAERGLWTSRDRAWWLWRIGLVALWHVESSWTRDWTRVPCIGRYSLNHWTVREAWHVDSELWRVGSGSLTSVRTQAACIGSAESQPLNPPGESRSRGSWRLRQRTDSAWPPTLTHCTCISSLAPPLLFPFPKSPTSSCQDEDPPEDVYPQLVASKSVLMRTAYLFRLAVTLTAASVAIYSASLPWLHELSPRI